MVTRRAELQFRLDVASFDGHPDRDRTGARAGSSHSHSGEARCVEASQPLHRMRTVTQRHLDHVIPWSRGGSSLTTAVHVQLPCARRSLASHHRTK